MRILTIVFALVSNFVFASSSYNPASIFPESRNANYVGYIYPDFIYACSDSEKLVNRKNAMGYITDALCYSCPTDFPEWDNVIVNDKIEPDRWICQKPCAENQKRLPAFGNAGYACYTCDEVYKEWQGDQCVTKSCPDPLVLDTSTGKCIEYDVNCPQSQEKVYSYSSSRPYCTAYCGSNEYRTKDGFCKTVPVCPTNQTLTFTTETIKTTTYKDFKCEASCRSDQNEINGQCFDRCEPNEIFKDGRCISQTGIIDAINRLKNKVLNYNTDLNKDLNNISKSALDSLDNANNALDNVKPKQPNNDYDVTKLEADTPFNKIKNVFNENIFSSNKQCPVDRTFTLWGSSFDFKFSRVCLFLELLSYLVMSISIILSYFIIRRA